MLEASLLQALCWLAMRSAAAIAAKSNAQPWAHASNGWFSRTSSLLAINQQLPGVLLILSMLLQVKADRPPWYLSVICGALLRVIQQVNGRSADYLGFLEKGQLPPAKLTLTSFEEQLVLEGMPRLNKARRQPACLASCHAEVLAKKESTRFSITILSTQAKSQALHSRLSNREGIKAPLTSCWAAVIGL